jgi:uncharacterized protein with HEPN domain
VNAEEALNALVAILEQLRDLFPTDKGDWDGDAVVQLAVERLWITAGNLADAYRIEVGMPTGVEPWSELAGYRHVLAHALPGDLSSDRVFADTSADLNRILHCLRERLLER